MAESKEAQNCWEFWNCPQEISKECRAFKNDLGRYCWLGDSFHPKCKRDFYFCWDCPWYQKVRSTLY